MRKPAFCICENKDTDQLRGNREADQCLCFRYIDSTISLLAKYDISCLYPSCVAVQHGLCGIRSETPKTGFLTTRLKLAFEKKKSDFTGETWMTYCNFSLVVKCRIYNLRVVGSNHTLGICFLFCVYTPS